ncbi:MAG: hypothetical protein U1F83_09170 [Verrucomicrobiota bacterium]
MMRFLSRKALSEFECAWFFQMSANRFRQLDQLPAANDLRLHRAIFYNGQQGWTETLSGPTHCRTMRGYRSRPKAGETSRVNLVTTICAHTGLR